MEMTYYLAVDIGASSGRHMLSHLEDGKLVLEEIYRFPNGMTEKNGHKVWRAAVCGDFKRHEAVRQTGENPAQHGD